MYFYHYAKFNFKIALDKEMKLTQDLMELFVEYQVPSNKISYNGFAENVATHDKISNVRDSKGSAGRRQYRKR